MKTYKVAVGSKAECTDKLCRSNFYSCPDYGSHDGGIVTASYHDCTCSCCKEGTCGQGLKEYTFEAGGQTKCTPDACSSNFYGCPDPGAHNADAAGTASDALVFATYHDCMCACCKAGECPTLKYSMFHAGSKEKCNKEGCSSKFYACPDAGAHNSEGQVVASYSGPPASPPSVAAAAGVSPARVAEKGETVMPTYGVALLVLVFVGTFIALVSVFVYRRVQRERGFRWVQFTDIQNNVNVGEATNGMDGNDGGRIPPISKA